MKHSQAIMLEIPERENIASNVQFGLTFQLTFEIPTCFNQV